MSPLPDHGEEMLQKRGNPDDSPAVPKKKLPRGQPKGLWVLFLTEMWEKFSYCGMRALLVLYLIAQTNGENPGFGWNEDEASILYGWYTGLVYLTPIIGGWLADKLLGVHRSMLIGGWIIAAGHFCLAFTEAFGHSAAEVIGYGTSPGPFLTFMTGLVLIIIGTGFFKPCVPVMVGQLYGEDDPRRDSGFTIFYMGINVGAFLSAVVAGTLGEKIGWHWGFGSAGVGMVTGLLTYQFFRPMFLKGIGLPLHHGSKHEAGSELTPEQIERDEYERIRPLTRVDIERMAVVMILGVFAIAFWIAFEQAGSSLNVFASEKTDRHLFGLQEFLPQSWCSLVHPFPTTWYQSVNPAAVVLFAPVFAWLWMWLDRRGRQPSTPVKFAIGLMLLSLGYMVMTFAALEADRHGLAGPHWLLFAYTLLTWGELCLSPVGLSMVTKLSPARCTSMMMGLYFCTFFVSNVTAGYVASCAKTFVERGETGQGILAGQADFFFLLFVVPFAVGIIVLLLSPVIKRMMHGVR